MQASHSKAEVVFSSDVRNMDDWSRRTRIPLTTAEALGATYARAHRWLQSLRMQLIQTHGWRDSPSDPRMLFTLETSSLWRSSAGLPAGPPLKLSIPKNASSFFSPERYAGNSFCYVLVLKVLVDAFNGRWFSIPIFSSPFAKYVLR